MHPRRRSGLTLLELIISATIMTAVVTAAAALLRGGHDAWRVQQGDSDRIQSAAASLRHIVRHVRQCQSVTAISTPSETSGQISVQMPDGSNDLWGHVARNKTVTYGDANGSVGTNPLLAQNIEELRFTAYQADGTTPTTVVNDIQAVECRIRVELPRETNNTVWLSSWIWLRAW